MIFFFLTIQNLSSQDFLEVCVVISMTLTHLYKIHLIQLIINITGTSQESYICNLYSENIWRTELILENLKDIL